jgi:hypothetical protein
MPLTGSPTRCASGCDGRRRLAAGRVAPLCLWLVAASAAGIASAAEVVVRPYASVSEQYSDNIFFSDQPTEDYVTSFALGLAVDYSGPRLSAYLTGANTGQIFARDTSEDRAAASQFATLGARYSISPRWSVAMSDGLNRVTQTRTLGPPTPSDSPADPLPPTDPGNQASLLVREGDVFSNVFSISTSYLFAPLVSGSLSYTNNVNDFSNPGGTDLTNRGLASLGYQWRPDWSFNVFFSFQQFNFTDQPDSQTYNTGLGTETQLSPTWSAGGSLGAFVNHVAGGGGDEVLPQSVGPTFDLYANGGFERWSLNVGGGQGITTSGGIAGLSVTRNAYLTVTYQLLRDLSAFVNGTYSRFDTEETTFDIVQGIVGLNYVINEYLSATVTYAYSFRHTDQDTALLSSGDVDANRVLLGLSASFDLWRGTTGEMLSGS